MQPVALHRPGPVAGQPGHRDAPGAAAVVPDDRGDPAPPPASWTAAASSTGRTRLRRRSSRRGPPPRFYPRPGLLRPRLHRAVVALDGPPRAQLAGPAAASAAASPDPRDGVLHLIRPPGPARGAASTAGLPTRRPAARPPAPHPAPPAAAQPAGAAQPARGRPARPGRQPAACGDRRTDRSLTRSSAAIAADGTRCSNLRAASSRTCSRRLGPRRSGRRLAHTACALHTATSRTVSPSGHH